ncbi:hypothetical protein [Carnobacterium maltaromaticum]|uniref:hypothetical protein n=1 Tax=Carnobacterium maltaromaticum TaxID=2751 RepID=UPI00295EDEF4|nr:hypothetical protein [Carnobacterium maltaromaticum]
MENEELISKLDNLVFSLRSVSEDVTRKTSISHRFHEVDGNIETGIDHIIKAISILSTLEEN